MGINYLDCDLVHSPNNDLLFKYSQLCANFSVDSFRVIPFYAWHVLFKI